MKPQDLKPQNPKQQEEQDLASTKKIPPLRDNRKISEAKLTELLDAYEEVKSVGMAAKKVGISYQAAKRNIDNNLDLNVNKENYRQRKETLREKLLQLAINLALTFKGRRDIDRLPPTVRGTLLGITTDKIIKMDGDGNKQVIEFRQVAEDIEKDQIELAELKKLLILKIANDQNKASEN